MRSAEVDVAHDKAPPKVREAQEALAPAHSPGPAASWGGQMESGPGQQVSIQKWLAGTERSAPCQSICQLVTDKASGRSPPSQGARQPLMDKSRELLDKRERAPLLIRTEAGEVLKRRRVDSPWVAAGADRTRGSLKLALDIDSSNARVQRAMSHFATLTYAQSTCDAKEALFHTWRRICELRGIQTLPVTAESLIEVAAILRVAGCRPTYSFACEAKQ